MPYFLEHLFSTSDFPARWHCGYWTPFHGWLHILSDLAVFGAYLAIPIVLLFFVRKRPDMPFPRVFYLFGAFIIACGVTHLNEAVIFWYPIYRVAGLVKLTTGIVSWLTVLALIRVLPEALALRTPAELEREVERRTQDLAEAKAASAHLAEIVRSSDDAIFSMDLQGRVLSWNPAAEALHGHAHADAIGMSARELFPRPEEFEQLLSSFRAGEANHLETTQLTRDGREVPVALSGSPIRDASDAVTGGSVIVRDIGAQLEAQRERERLIGELQRSNSELEQFAYVASHDLQEPLRMVASYTQLLGQRYEGQLDEKADRYIHYASDGAKRMQQLLSDLLAFSRAGADTTQAEEVSAEDVLGDVLANLEAAMADSGGTVTHDPLPKVWVPRSQLSQVFQNLVGNALKFAREGEAPQVHVSAEREGERWRFSVKDNGIGLDSRYEERIFRPFQRLHERGRFAGSGIGLSIVRKVVERHGGEVGVTANSGEGSTFWFTLGVGAAT